VNIEDCGFQQEQDLCQVKEEIFFYHEASADY
jgi:hypothetical protein